MITKAKNMEIKISMLNCYKFIQRNIRFLVYDLENPSKKSQNKNATEL